MGKMKFRHWAGGLVLILAAAFIVLNTEIPIVQASEVPVLKVAFPELEGMSQTDQYGVRTGLMVDYLNEIAKYTGWKYEYISVNSDEMIPNFLEGKYDLMGGTFYQPGFEEYFAYPDYFTGRSRAVLLCLQDDDRLMGYDLTSLNGKTIGVFEKATDKIRYLEEYLASNGLECQLRYYKYEDMEDGSLYKKLRGGEVDMLLGNNLEAGGEFRMVASFQAQPYYIVTTVGNSEVLEGLNMALQHILESTPNFADEVYYKNFPDARIVDIQLNDEEQSYIEQKRTITVAIPLNWYPFYNSGDSPELPEGLLSELFENISAFTGLEFQPVFGNSYAECLSMVQQGKADILGTYMDGEERAFEDGLALTQPYINLNNIVLTHKRISYPDAGLSCGILKGSMLPEGFEASEIHSYETIPELLKAVNTREVDYIYGVSAILEKEMQSHRYINVVPISRESDSTNVTFGIAWPVTPELLTILNKAISNISTEEKNAMLNRNLVSIGYTSFTLQELIYANPLACIFALTGLLLLVMAIILLIIRGRMRNALMESRLEAVEAKSLAKSGFLSQMSHEIRTPMNAIIGLTDLTRMKGKEIPPEIENNLKKIHSSSQYLLALLNDILDMSRIENGKMELEQKEFSLSLMLHELQEMMSAQAEEKRLKFHGECKISHDWLIGDPVRLRQILTNLLSNAVKFTPPEGSVTLRVDEISCQEGRAEYHFSVQDTGVGICPEEQERIFVSFEQLKPSVSHSAGTGLGLPISRNIARLMGGDLHVKSEPGKGSEFYMTLKLPLGAGTPPEASLTGGQGKSLEGMKILLAEDNDLNAEIAQEMLAVRGIEACRAVNGEEAVELFTASPAGEYQAILMDIQMPVKNGFEAAKEIRASGRPDAGVPIIAMTANTFKEDKERAYEAGMNGFVSKPVDPERLFSELQEYAPH